MQTVVMMFLFHLYLALYLYSTIT